MILRQLTDVWLSSGQVTTFGLLAQTFDSTGDTGGNNKYLSYLLYFQ
jgi:hypothetical protein